MKEYEERALNFFEENKKTGCWEWTGTIRPDGYGQLSCNYKKKRAHRIFYEIYKGKIPEGLLVLHKCDNRKCVNPKHLFVGTHTDNMDDMMRKDRSARLDKNSHYGQKWVFNDSLKENKSVNAAEVDYWLNLGWSLGLRHEYQANRRMAEQVAGIEVATGELMSAARLGEYRKKNKVTYRNLSKMSGFSPSYLWQLFNQKRKMTEAMYHKLKADIDSIS